MGFGRISTLHSYRSSPSASLQALSGGGGAGNEAVFMAQEPGNGGACFAGSFSAGGGGREHAWGAWSTGSRAREGSAVVSSPGSGGRN